MLSFWFLLFINLHIGRILSVPLPSERDIGVVITIKPQIADKEKYSVECEYL